MKNIADKKKQAWVERWMQDNSDVREGWIKRTDGLIGYVYLQNPDYIVRGDFLPVRGVLRRIWVPWYKRFQIYEMQYSSDLQTVMIDVEEFEKKAARERGAYTHNSENGYAEHLKDEDSE